MVENEIEYFISNTIKQIKSGLPKGFILNHELNFDISLTTTKLKQGKIDIHIAGVGGSSKTQLTHRVKFSIIDEKSRDKNIAYIKKTLGGMFEEIKELDQIEE